MSQISWAESRRHQLATAAYVRTHANLSGRAHNFNTHNQFFGQIVKIYFSAVELGTFTLKYMWTDLTLEPVLSDS